LTELRHAILFSGMSFRRHVNALELSYRALVDHLGFAAANIHVMNYDGSLRAFGDEEDTSTRTWPGDGTPHRMIVNAEGSRAALRAALQEIATRLGPEDQLFINTTGHGGHHGQGFAPDLITYPYSERYNCRDFCADLAKLPPHRSLVVLMAQCFSGGFNRAILDASPADLTCVAAATSETRPSFMCFEDPNWDSFQRNWISAIARHTTLRQAFEYARTCPGSNPHDSPHFAARPDSAGELTLAA
jgi:hypothetical protein